MTLDEIKRFAQRIERLCDFLIEKGRENKLDQNELDVLHELKDEAANIQNGVEQDISVLVGIANAVGRR